MRPALIALLLWADVHALPASLPRPPRLIDEQTFARLCAAVAAEPSSDGKLELVRAVAAGWRYLFTARHATPLLDAFTFWSDRVAALRLLPLASREEAARLRSYFDAAPEPHRAEARHVLDGD